MFCWPPSELISPKSGRHEFRKTNRQPLVTAHRKSNWSLTMFQRRLPPLVKVKSERAPAHCSRTRIGCNFLGVSIAFVPPQAKNEIFAPCKDLDSRSKHDFISRDCVLGCKQEYFSSNCRKVDLFLTPLTKLIFTRPAGGISIRNGCCA